MRSQSTAPSREIRRKKTHKQSVTKNEESTSTVGLFSEMISLFALMMGVLFVIFFVFWKLQS